MIAALPVLAGFIALAVVALTGVALALFVRRRRKVARGIGDPVIVRELVGTDLLAVPWARVLVVGLAAVAIGTAFRQAARATQLPPARGPVVLILDASGSMLVDDVGGARLEVQRSVARALVDALPGRTFGLVAFAGRAYALTPPTRDRAALEMYLSAVDPTIVTQSGSALGPAIRQGIGLSTGAGAQAGAIVLLSDGGDTGNENAALAAASVAREQGVRIHTVGIGTTGGGPVPALELASGSVQGFLRAPSGELLISGLNDGLLASIARRGGGTYLPADHPGLIETLSQAIDGAAEHEGRNESGIPGYVWLALAGFGLLVLEPVTSRVRRPT